MKSYPSTPTPDNRSKESANTHAKAGKAQPVTQAQNTPRKNHLGE